MKAYVIKRNDGEYYKDQLMGGLRFVDDLLDAEFYDSKLRAERIMLWIINNFYRYGISKEELKVVPVEIREIPNK